MQYFRKAGWHAGITERWNNHVGIRQDLFGFVDMILLKPAVFGTTFVQVSSFGGLPARIKKVLEDDRMRLVLIDMLNAGNQMWFVGWRKVGRFWQPSIRAASLADRVAETCGGSIGKPGWTVRISDVLKDGMLINPVVGLRAQP